MKIFGISENLNLAVSVVDVLLLGGALLQDFVWSQESLKCLKCFICYDAHLSCQIPVHLIISGVGEGLKVSPVFSCLLPALCLPPCHPLTPGRLSPPGSDRTKVLSLGLLTHKHCQMSSHHVSRFKWKFKKERKSKILDAYFFTWF